MPEPNFSESQLQQSVNTAIIRRILETQRKWYPAFVPSLPEELLLGWDSGFYLPWIGHAPHADHKGCNIFFQYKLSSLLTTRKAKEWDDWRCKYYRFTIPHNTQDATGQYVHDFHQWDRLKALADMGYPAFYATNSMLQIGILHTHEVAGSLLDHIPLLDIRLTPSGHHHVSFTDTSPHFFLHSEREEQKKLTFSSFSEHLNAEDGEPLAEQNIRLISRLKEIYTNDKLWREDLAVLVQDSNSPLPRRFQPVIKFHQLRAFIAKHIGARMVWYPTNNPG